MRRRVWPRSRDIDAAATRQARGADAMLRLTVDRLESAAEEDASDVAVRAAIREVVQSEDQVTRRAHGRFEVVLQSVDLDGARRVGERLLEALRTSLAGIPGITLSISIELAVLSGEAQSDQVVVLADAAPSIGQDHAATAADPPAGPESQDQDVWRRRIQSAAATNRLVLHYQPVIWLADGSVQYWEALLRMKDDHGGLLLPGEFLPYAFRFGLMPHLDLWVVEAVLQTLAGHPGLCVATNLSLQTIRHDDTMERIEQAVRARQLRSGQLMFEVAEVATEADVERVQAWGRRLRSLGCWFALDHFGLDGATSLERLRRIPVDVAKVNSGYLQQLLDEAGRASFVEAVRATCRSANIRLVASCVESETAVERLRAAGITLGQGFLWGQPAPMETVAEKLSSAPGAGGVHPSD